MSSEVLREQRRRRADGERTHATILEAATRLASVEGLHALTIGGLAEEIGVSKSGLYAHFRSKETLQLEVIAAAGAIHEREVLVPMLAAPAGLRRIRALCDAYFSYVERWVFPGGCFFSALLAEADAREGPIHDAVKSAERESLEGLTKLIREAQGLEEIDPQKDAAQLAFQISALMDAANYRFVLFRDPEFLRRGREAIDDLLR